MKRRVKGIWIPIGVWEMKVNGMLPIHRCVYSEIDSLSKPGYPCRASNTYLSKFFQVSTSTIKRAITFLYDEKLIRIWYEGAGSQKRCMVPSYILAQNDLGQNELGAGQNEPGLGQNELHRIPLDRFTNHKSVSRKKNLQTEVSSGLDNPSTAKPSAGRAKFFSEAAEFKYEVFRSHFTGTDYEVVDLKFYYEKLKAWSDQGNKRKNWIAVARMFILNDRRDKKLVTNNKNLNDEKSIIDLSQAKRLSRI